MVCVTSFCRIIPPAWKQSSSSPKSPCHCILAFIFLIVSESLLRLHWILETFVLYLNIFCFQPVLSHLLPVLDRLLEKALKRPKELLKDEALVLHLILGKYNEFSAPLLSMNQQSLDLFVKALHASQEVYAGLSTFQIRALGQVSMSFFFPRHSSLKWRRGSLAFCWQQKLSKFLLEHSTDNPTYILKIIMNIMLIQLLSVSPLVSSSPSPGTEIPALHQGLPISGGSKAVLPGA